MRIFLAVVLLAGAAVGGAWPAWTARARGVSTLQEGLATVDELLRQRHPANAERLLWHLKRTRPYDPRVNFKLAHLLMARQEYAGAAVLLRQMLAHDPGLTRVRLDLGRALFLAGDDDAARHHFELALAEDLPPPVEAKVMRFLAEIRRRKDWSLRVNLAVAPDTNINAASEQETVTLWGIPFTLPPDSRATSGVGLLASVDGERQFRLNERLRLRAGGGVEMREYPRRRFDQTIVTGRLGPRALLGADGEVSLLAVGYRRWLGGEGYERALGARLEADHRLSRRLSLGARVQRLDVDYDAGSSLDGHINSVSLLARFALTSTTGLHPSLGYVRERREAPHMRRREYRLALGLSRDLPWGISAYVEPGIALARHDVSDPIFAVVREDTTASGRISLSNRFIDWRGFTPVVTYTYDDRRSNISMYAYDRHRLHIGITRLF